MGQQMSLYVVTNLVNNANKLTSVTKSVQDIGDINRVDCDGDIRECVKAKELVQLVNNYERDQNHSGLYQYMPQILNLFHHCLVQHEGDDFDFIYDLFGRKCGTENCAIIRYHRRYTTHRRNDYDDRLNKCDDINMDEYHNKMNVIYWMNCIHRHYLHSYDMAYRLPKYDRRKNLIQRCNILLNKRQRFFQLLNDKDNITNSIHNKYSTDLGKTKTIERYSYGFKLYYWDYHKRNECYVPPKYINLKQELTQNGTQSISVKEFIRDYKKVEMCKRLERYKDFKANISGYCVREQKMHTHPCHYGLKDCSLLSSNHLLSVIVYCNHDVLQRQYSKTLRKQNNDETMDVLIERNSHYHHLSKYLHETVNIFGTKNISGKVSRFYHGISKSMLFEQTHANIYGVLSTTALFNVAVSFTNKESGFVLELYPAHSLRYFPCSWLSGYSNECEKLFIGGFLSFTFNNITNTVDAICYEEYIKPMAVIDTMTNGKFFNSDKSIIGKLLKEDHWNPKLVGAQELNPLFQHNAVKLIENEVKINILDGLDKYICNLFHNICINKGEVILNWRSMKVIVSHRWMLGDGGHCGYKFLKPFFCLTVNDVDVLNLEFIHRLYPKLSYIEVIALHYIDPLNVKCIYNYLLKNKEFCIKKIGLYLLKDSTQKQSISEAINLFEADFDKINVFFFSKH